MNFRCFVDVDGNVWTINSEGKSAFPADIEIIDGDVRVLGADDGTGARLIEDEYVLWPSLTSLALALEQDIPASDDGSVSLDQAVAEFHHRAENFKNYWIQNHVTDPVGFPMSLPADNAGTWSEQINTFTDSAE